MDCVELISLFYAFPLEIRNQFNSMKLNVMPIQWTCVHFIYYMNYIYQALKCATRIQWIMFTELKGIFFDVMLKCDTPQALPLHFTNAYKFIYYE